MSDHVNTHNIVLIWSLCVISVERLLLYVERLLLSVIAIFYWQFLKRYLCSETTHLFGCCPLSKVPY
jgi:hypothetical protein